MVSCRLLCLGLVLASGLLRPPAAGQGARLPGGPGPTTGTPPKGAGAPAVKPPAQVLKAATLFEQAVEATRAGRLSQAAALYRRVLALTPGAYPAQVNLASVLMSLGRADEAAAGFRRAAAMEPKNPFPRVQLALLWLNARKADRARAEAVTALRLDPRNAQAHFVLGSVQAGANDLAGAEASFRKAAQYAPRSTQAHYNLGVTLARAKRFEAALQSFAEVVKLEPANGQAHFYIGMVQQMRKQYRLAIPAFRKAVELMPNDPAAHYDLGLVCQIEAERTKEERLQQEAIGALVRAAQLAPKFLPARVNLARLYYQIGNHRQAAAHFLAAYGIKPTDPRLLADAGIAETYAAAGERDATARQALWKSAEAHLKGALAKEPRGAVHAALGYLYEQQSKQELAAAQYEAWTKRFPTEAAGFVALGRARELQNKTAEAVALFEKAIALEPKGADARRALARLYENQGKPDAAMAQYRAIADADPRDAEARKVLGQMLLNKRRFAEGIEVLTAVKRLAPRDPAPYIAIGSAYERDNKPDDAIREFRALAALDPKDAGLRSYVARSMENLKRYDEAVAEYRAIEALAGNQAHFALNIPRLLELAGKGDEALAEYRRLSEKDPRNVQFHASFATALEKRARWGEAVTAYEAIIEADPSATWAWLRIGDAHMQGKRPEDARLAYTRALGTATSAAEAYRKLEAVYEAQGKQEAWYDFVKERLAARPAEGGALAALEASAGKLKRQEDLAAVVKAIGAGAGSRAPGFLTAAANLLVRLGKPDDALELQRQLARVSPDDWAVRQTIAGRMESAGRVPEAIVAYEEIIRIRTVPAPTLLTVRLKLAALYEQNGQRTQAEQQYRDVLKQDPSNPAAAAALKRLGA